jgi:hypothetical protein
MQKTAMRTRLQFCSRRVAQVSVEKRLQILAYRRLQLAAGDSKNDYRDVIGRAAIERGLD